MTSGERTVLDVALEIDFLADELRVVQAALGTSDDFPRQQILFTVSRIVDRLRDESAALETISDQSHAVMP